MRARDVLNLPPQQTIYDPDNMYPENPDMLKLLKQNALDRMYAMVCTCNNGTCLMGNSYMMAVKALAEAEWAYCYKFNANDRAYVEQELERYYNMNYRFIQ